MFSFSHYEKTLQEGLQNPSARLTPSQLEVIDLLCNGGHNLLYIDKTGAGKSETYFIATKLLRNHRCQAGPVIVITPLIALMDDQVRRARKFGLNAYAYYSCIGGSGGGGGGGGMTEMERGVVHLKLLKNEVDLLFMTAEMLNEISQDSRTIRKKTSSHPHPVSSSSSDGFIYIQYMPKLLQYAPALRRHPPDLSGGSNKGSPVKSIQQVAEGEEITSISTISPFATGTRLKGGGGTTDSGGGGSGGGNGVSWSFIPLLVIDEIHYIAEAGHDFRCDYANVWKLLENHDWYQKTQKLGLTATITPRVRSSLYQALPAIETWKSVIGNLYRDNIAIRILPKPINDELRLDYIYQLYQKDPSAYILVFCKSRKDVKKFSNCLKTFDGINDSCVSYYHASKNIKDLPILKSNEEKFRNGIVHILFSTCALGLGYDKTDINHVVHMWTPNSLVQYYQEFGRAGRSKANAHEIAFVHMLPTTPWNPANWVAALSSIIWFLAREKDQSATIGTIKDRGTSLGNQENDILQAIQLGIKKGFFLKSIEEGKKIEKITLLNANESLQQIDKIYAQLMGEEVQMMKKLTRNCSDTGECLWNFIVNQFEGQRNGIIHCGKCSGMSCKPGGDINPRFKLEETIFYTLSTPETNISIISLSKKGENVIIDEERLKEIFSIQIPSMVIDPPGKWTLCPLPDSENKNLIEAREIAQWLGGMNVNGFISQNPKETRKVSAATSKVERLDILRNKFLFDWEKMPNIGNILLYDDFVNSGDSLDTVIQAIQFQAESRWYPIDQFVALTKHVLISNQPGAPLVRKNCTQFR